MTYKTPDVYVEEISVFPPSVAEVETAIPAFVGYTAKYETNGKSSLKKPTVVNSLVEFEEIFGKGPEITVTSVTVDSSNNVSDVKIDSSFYLYDSVRLYFANGGGKCYIVSVGDYKSSIGYTALKDGLETLRKEDEPTLLLFPDAVNLSTDNFHTLQQNALDQAEDLQDRFVIMDLKYKDKVEFESDYSTFRDKIGMKSLKYGAAYMPYLKSNLPVTVRFKDFYKKVTKGSSTLNFSNLISETTDDGKDFKKVYDNYVAVQSQYATNLTDVKDFSSNFEDLVSDYKNDKTVANYTKLVEHGLKGVKFIVDNIGLSSVIPNMSVTDNNFSTTAKNLANGRSEDVIAFLQVNKDLGKDADVGGNINWLVTLPNGTYKFNNTDYWTTNPTTGLTHEALTGADAEEKMDNSLTAVRNAFDGIKRLVQDYITSILEIDSVMEYSIYQQIPVANIIAKSIESEFLILPPSGAIAGIYADTDAKRGVWKAPANVSLTAVAGLTEKIDSKTQESLNVDVTAGKSINAIREFSGRGILVWGARTLAGNDNEWRYVPVRRFFNMVEESIKKSTYWAVFEPNDANLWVKLKSMIENYLIQKWREGALAGSKPEQAFYVNVGLGKTMTAQDILEGRLIIDIGMAAVRPAEFIVLRFMHKMQEA